MNQRELNRLIGYGIAIVFVYSIVSQFIGFIVSGVLAMVAFRIYQEYEKRK